jgi:hypothetical protein
MHGGWQGTAAVNGLQLKRALGFPDISRVAGATLVGTRPGADTIRTYVNRHCGAQFLQVSIATDGSHIDNPALLSLQAFLSRRSNAIAEMSGQETIRRLIN